MIQRPVLRYYGGKFRMAPWIISCFPEHRVYVEPYGGAGSVLLQKPRSWIEIYNDIWRDVVNVFRVLRDPEQAAELERLLRLTPFAREEFDDCREEIRSSIEDSVELARRTIFRSFSGFGSSSLNKDSKVGFRRSSVHKPYGMEWKSFPKCIASYTERLQGVIIEHQSAEQTIANYDSPDTLFYVDPPYLQSERNMNHGNAEYCHEMSEEEHRHLAEVLQSVRGMVVLSGYPSELYDRELYSEWRRITKKSTCGGNGHGKSLARIEVLWLNPGIASNRMF